MVWKLLFERIKLHGSNEPDDFIHTAVIHSLKLYLCSAILYNLRFMQSGSIQHHYFGEAFIKNSGNFSSWTFAYYSFIPSDISQNHFYAFLHNTDTILPWHMNCRFRAFGKVLHHASNAQRKMLVSNVDKGKPNYMRAGAQMMSLVSESLLLSLKICSLGLPMKR